MSTSGTQGASSDEWMDHGGSVPATTVYVAGSGHSGSTLLDLMLGGHPKISTLGEAHLLYLCTKMSGTPYRCACGRHVLECPFWRKVEDAAAERIGDRTPGLLQRLITTDPSYLDHVTDDDPVWIMPLHLAPVSRFNPRLDRLAMVVGSKRLWSALAKVSPNVQIRRTAIQNSVLLYEAVRTAHSTPVVVDSTKNSARLKGLYLKTPHRFLVLYLLHDGRAVTWSRMVREGFSMAECARAWKLEHMKLTSVMWAMPRSIVRKFRYEDLCRNPRAELTRVCEWLGLPYDPQMLEIGSADRHGVGGNPMRYGRRENAIRFDERWRDEIGAADLRTFDKIAGRLNRRLGYH